MAESLVQRGELVGHAGWVTSISTPLDPNSDIILSSSRYGTLTQLSELLSAKTSYTVLAAVQCLVYSLVHVGCSSCYADISQMKPAYGDASHHMCNQGEGDAANTAIKHFDSHLTASNAIQG